MVFFIKMSVWHLQKKCKQFLKETMLPQTKPLKCFLMGIGQDVFQVTSRASLHDALPLSREEFCGPIRGFLNSARGVR